MCLCSTSHIQNTFIILKQNCSQFKLKTIHLVLRSKMCSFTSYPPYTMAWCLCTKITLPFHVHFKPENCREQIGASDNTHIIDTSLYVSSHHQFCEQCYTEIKPLHTILYTKKFVTLKLCFKK